MSMSDAKKILKQYFAEHKDDEKGNYYDLYALLLGQMEEDGFFGLIGLEQTMKEVEQFVQKIVESNQANKKKAK